jgi:hypothetical protein
VELGTKDLYDYIGVYLYRQLEDANGTDEMSDIGSVFLNYAKLGVILGFRTQDMLDALVTDWENQGLTVHRGESLH